MKAISPEKVKVTYRKTQKRDVHWASMSVGGKVIMEHDPAQWNSIKASVSRYNTKKKVYIACTKGKDHEGREVLFVKRIQ